MKIILSVLVFSVLLAGCVNGRFHKRTITAGPCGAVDGYTYTGIAYGNAKMFVIPLSRIQANTEWRFYLLPIGSRGGVPVYGAKAVTISGKPAGSLVYQDPGVLVPYVIPNGPGSDGWLAAVGDFNTDGYITACVPANVAVGQEWHFTVDIVDVGRTDPRGRVE